ncbi:MAG: carboxynorspermidine decarboxylase [Leptospiraceae bacterium]|nr:carboxynorspermidine decarboxylase [Leptospiraceae bacterium]
MDFKTPYYVIDEKKLLKNLKKIQYVREHSGTKSVLALKCFSTWCVFDLMRQYMDGTTSSSLYEAKLGREKFGKEVHGYSVAYSKEELLEVAKIADKIIFNSLSQLKMLHKNVKTKNIGLRVNPKFSYSHFDLADPARRYSKLGISDTKELSLVSHLLKGLMFHFNCENDNFTNFSENLDSIGKNYTEILKKMEWISLGGGLYFTKEGYPLEQFCDKLKKFSEKYQVQVYLEPGEAAITRSAELVTKVLDVIHNEIDIAIVDASIEAHMLDLLIYGTDAKMEMPKGNFPYMVAGRSCLAGDVFGTFHFKSKLKVGSTIRFADAAGYTMVKKNWFNGLPMPSIVVKRLDGRTEEIRNFNYKDFKKSLS